MDADTGTILVVDDDMLTRILLSTGLQEQGYIVETAENGRQALSMLESRPYDVVLLDLLMPEMDGYQVLERMKDDPVLRHLPVIVVSALDEMESVIRCIEMGAADHLPKPFDPVLLRARVNASLTSKRLRDMEQAYLRQLQAEQERSERLLLNILPEPIAEQLKQGQSTVAEYFAEVTVLFADLVGFTAFAAENPPGAVVELLNTTFSTFDDLADLHGLEKIKTVGDAYMAAGGIPLPRPDHAQAIADMALDMREKAAQLRGQGGRALLPIRIGIHSGPVVAGVIGTKKIAYDLWGDTVNAANWLQMNSRAGSILVSQATYLALEDKYHFQEHGVVEMGSEEEGLTYWLLGRRMD